MSQGVVGSQKLWKLLDAPCFVDLLGYSLYGFLFHFIKTLYSCHVVNKNFFRFELFRLLLAASLLDRVLMNEFFLLLLDLFVDVA